MPQPQLSVVPGALPRAKMKVNRAHDALAKRWRATDTLALAAEPLPEVISLMDAWIRRLEREATEADKPLRHR